jgi:hypothetical protein
MYVVRFDICRNILDSFADNIIIIQSYFINCAITYITFLKQYARGQYNL